MRKIILSFITFTGLLSFSHEFEANIKVGYDFFRYVNYKMEKAGSYHSYTNVDNANYERGFVVGVELLPFTFIDEKIKLGVGLEYNFGEKTLKYRRMDDTPKLANKPYVGSTMLPLYLTGKFTYYRPKNKDLNLYTFARLGYAVSKETNENKMYINSDTSGIYFGIGLGLDYKYFLAEILYDGRYKDRYIEANAKGYEPSHVHLHIKDFHHKVGIRLGVQLGSQHFKKCPKCEPKIVEKIVEVEKVVEKKTTNKIIIKKFDISAEALFGFNKYKLEDLQESGKQEIEEKVKELLKSGFEITGINVIGHTDRLGKDSYNYKLGLDRANTIAEYLKELGIKVEIKSSSKGKTEPKVHCNNIKSTNKLKECLQPNRRVELQFLGLETQKKVEEVIENK